MFPDFNARGAHRDDLLREAELDWFAAMSCPDRQTGTGCAWGLAITVVGMNFFVDGLHQALDSMSCEVHVE